MTENLKFERADWTSFRTIEGLQQKAGVVQSKLRRLVLKELADNALDTGARVRIGQLPDGGYFIEDDGSGIEGQPEEIARLFSIARPMISTKLLRLPNSRRARQRPASCCWRRPRIRGLSCRHYPQSPDRTSPRARRLDHGRHRDAGRLPDRHPR